MLGEELEQVREVVQDIVCTLIKRKEARSVLPVASSSGSHDAMSQLAADLAALGIAAAGAPAPVKAAAASSIDSNSLKPQHQPQHQRVHQVMVQLQQGMLQLQAAVVQGGSSAVKGSPVVDKIRYNIGYSLGTFVRLYFGPTNLQDHPHALPDAFALALQQTHMERESALQVLISGLAGIKMM